MQPPLSVQGGWGGEFLESGARLTTIIGGKLRGSGLQYPDMNHLPLVPERAVMVLMGRRISFQ